jgi:hypothetical protein
VIVLDQDAHGHQPIMLTEFGGIAFSRDTEGTWGYSRVRTAKDLADHYRALLGVIHSSGIFAGFCYTQFTDTYQEANGLVYANRTPKFPIDEIASATTGALYGEGPPAAVGSVPRTEPLSDPQRGVDAASGHDL